MRTGTRLFATAVVCALAVTRDCAVSGDTAAWFGALCHLFCEAQDAAATARRLATQASAPFVAARKEVGGIGVRDGTDAQEKNALAELHRQVAELDAKAAECEQLAASAMFGNENAKKRNAKKMDKVIAKLLCEGGEPCSETGAKGYKAADSGKALGADMIWVCNVRSSGTTTGCGVSSGTSCRARKAIQKTSSPTRRGQKWKTARTRVQVTRTT
ncbi:hypothetical protein ERJ75_001394700 [Trypanosoma vivax]|nr:hypothetical protein ERJ75_001394700 [Trypanosoma vivax]